ncbi:MAG: glycosyltransferase family 2 protein, partial [Bacteroidetes bacterium]|nr:glycosyltransferase family 2 protein [Bacteroidota bacterium]
MASYNEAEVLTQKIKNSLELDYPEDKLQIYFITDGSNDNSTEIISAHSRINLFFKPEREGKVAAINRVMPFVTTPIVVFSDANTFLNKGCIREIVKHYSNEKTGAVAGEKKVLDLNKTGDAASAGEGLYWKYESFLKKLDAEFYSVVGAAGELFSIRTELFEPTAKDVLLDDFIISLKICQKGYRVAYEPNAYASEAPSDSIKEEQKRKIRIS